MGALRGRLWSIRHQEHGLTHRTHELRTRTTSDDPFKYDVQMRVPDVQKAKRVLGFEATTPLETILQEVIPWVVEQIKLGNI